MLCPYPFLLLCQASCLPVTWAPPSNRASESTEGKTGEVKVGTYVDSMLLILSYTNKKYYYYLTLEEFSRAHEDTPTRIPS